MLYVGFYFEEMMKVLGSIEWRAFSSGCREVVHLRVHKGWRMERFDKCQDINGVHDYRQHCAKRNHCRYLIYSEAGFEVFRPAGATRCTDGGEIWHGGGEVPSLSLIHI